MNIVQVSGGELRIPVEKGGGSEEYILNISKGLSRAGHNVTILDRKYSPNDTDIEYIDGVKIARLKARKFALPNLTINLTLNYISFALQVRKYLTKTDFDVLHVHVSITGLFLLVISPNLKKRLFYTSHATRRGKKSLTPLDRMAISLENQLVKRVRMAIVLNELVREGLIKARVKPERVAILPMGTNTERFNPIIGVGDVRQKYGFEGGVTILFVGRIRADKGVEFLVKAANIVVNVFGYKQVQFILVGPTEEFVSRKSRGSLYLDNIRQLIKGYGLQEAVRLTGAVPLDDLRRLYVASDIFVLPSLTEAAPQAVIEAMSSSKPVIGTKVGAVPTQIVDGQSGFLIDPADERQLAEKIKYLIDNPSEAKRMGTHGRKIAEEEFDWSKIVERLLQVYEESLRRCEHGTNTVTGGGGFIGSPLAMNQAVFLDRDGVITQEPPYYAHKVDQLKLIPKAANAIRRLNENGFVVIIASNQAGIARGYYREEDAVLFNQAVQERLAKEGAHIDAIYYCPHHPEARLERYRLDCDCRKPRPGMLTRAEKELNIDLKQSFVVGDKLSDIEAGEKAGCKTVLVKTGYGAEELKRNHVDCNYIADNLYDAVEHILGLSQ